jgi:hypothetical protein
MPVNGTNCTIKIISLLASLKHHYVPVLIHRRRPVKLLREACIESGLRRLESEVPVMIHFTMLEPPFHPTGLSLMDAAEGVHRSSGPSISAELRQHMQHRRQMRTTAAAVPIGSPKPAMARREHLRCAARINGWGPRARIIQVSQTARFPARRPKFQHTTLSLHIP